MQQRGQLRDIGCFRCALSRASNFAAERRFAEKEAASRRATDAQVLEDAERLIAAWNERQAKRMPMLFSPGITLSCANHLSVAVFFRSWRSDVLWL